MNQITLPKEYNYIGVFLTLSCNLKCSYCINIQDYKRSNMHKANQPLNGEQWIQALSRIPSTNELPITLQGGEPTVHPDFYQIIKYVKKPMDLLTNLQFDIDEFINKVPPRQFYREAPYASIRASFHPEQMELDDTVKRAKILVKHGYQLGVYMVQVPEQMGIAEEAAFKFKEANIDFRFKTLLGEHKGKVYGEYKYPDALWIRPMKEVQCRTTELLVAPNGDIHRCHSDLYNLRPSINNLLEESFNPSYNFRYCKFYGTCVGCDIKITTNRFQESGWTSVEII